jgi:aryl-alcohol dehydrogenase-like predicted oxidoreductase
MSDRRAPVTWPPSSLRGASRIGFGLAAIGRPAYITTGRDVDLGADRSPAAMRHRAETLLDVAYASGVRYIDAARSYVQAESFVAGWLAKRRLTPHDVAVGSKWGYTYVGGWRLDAERQEVQDLSVDAFRRQLDETRATLGEHLTLYQIHSATPANGVLGDRQVLAALAGLRREGVAVGVTVSGPQQAEAIDTAVALGIFDAVQATWNLLEPSAGEALARAHAAGMTVIVKEALANGRLTSRGDQPALLAAAGERGVTPDALAIRAVLACPWADVTLSGAVTVEALRSNLNAEHVPWDDELGALVRRLARPADIYWRERALRPWA